ncbi:hypothetical protein KIPB_011517 [Kipferlia bialata]|uniref:Uncharacterized protein n=1 Tax=Kipferlia bialata TaxID=797122 RepID=A0A391NZD0_9EUKA|nr:hypothetical protein KIPB_011517 [Kipferlia bialata]|eukprot:g11517.t1
MCDVNTSDLSQDGLGFCPVSGIGVQASETSESESDTSYDISVVDSHSQESQQLRQLAQWPPKTEEEDHVLGAHPGVPCVVPSVAHETGQEGDAAATAVAHRMTQLTARNLARREQRHAAKLETLVEGARNREAPDPEAEGQRRIEAEREAVNTAQNCAWDKTTVDCCTECLGDPRYAISTQYKMALALEKCFKDGTTARMEIAEVAKDLRRPANDKRRPHKKKKRQRQRGRR